MGSLFFATYKCYLYELYNNLIYNMCSHFLFTFLFGDELLLFVLKNMELHISWLFILISVAFFIQKNTYAKCKVECNELLKTQELAQKKLTDQLNEQTITENQILFHKEKDDLAQKIKEKTIELAIKAKEDEDRLKLLDSIRDKITEAEMNPNVYKLRLKEMRSLLDSYLEIENKTFEIQMDLLHQDFFKSLKEKFPQLSIYDLRLSAYLKLGFSSKEMAEILLVLPSSINVSRSRLRKKLGLQPSDDLYEFLNKI